MALNAVDDSGEEFWDISLPVEPYGTNAHRPDVMLVQFLVKAFFSTPGFDIRTKMKWNRILHRATSSGERFDDGVYGPLTREATLLYENYARRRYRDGVFRPEGARLLDQTDTYVTKMAHLNSIYRGLVVHFGWSPRQGARELDMNPLLVQALYPA